MSDQDKKLTVLALGVDPQFLKLVSTLKNTELKAQNHDPSILEGPVETPLAVILCGPSTIEAPTAEIGQTLRMFYPDLAIFYITEKRDGFHRKDLQKNGFTDAFLLPTDEASMVSAVKRQLALASSGKIKSYRTVQLVDLSADAQLGFDLYLHLPANNRYVRYVSGSEALGEERVDKLKKHNFRSAMVAENEMQKFYQFTARQLKAMGSDKNLSETERIEKREKAVRDLLTGIFSDSSKNDNIGRGREVMNDCQEIIKEYILSEDPSGANNWYERLMKASSGDSSAYSHTANVATLASLIAMALGIGDPKEMALAGMLHDIGLSDVPAAICLKSENERTSEEKKLYEEHPLHSIRLIQDRKLIVSEKVFKIIEQHHERFDGNGYPARLPGPRICPEAQILSFVDQVDEMAAPKEGVPNVTIVEAVRKICDYELGNPAKASIDPTLLRRIKDVFLKGN